jgi:hypothetical protein
MHPLPILFFCLLCSVCHSHSMHLLFPIHFSCCTTSLLPHTCITSPQQQQPHHFSVPCSYSFCAPCACNMRNLCILLISSTSRVLCLIIATLQLLWWFPPRVQHHWVLCRDSFFSLAVETLRLLYYSRAHPLCFSYRLQPSSSCQSPL